MSETSSPAQVQPLQPLHRGAREVEAHSDTTWEETGGYSWFATVDHKRIGILYLYTSLFFFAVGGLEALAMRLQLAQPNLTLISPVVFNQLFTMHGTTMIFLVVMPTIAGFTNYLVPLMIGARDMAFPRLNAFAYWLFPIGGFLLHFSLLAGGAPQAGWFSYAPLAETPYSSGQGTDYWIIALLVLGVGSVATAINVIATVFSLRAPGLTLQRLPLFVWMSLVTAILILLALPVLNASLVMLLIDRQLQAHFFTPRSGGDAVLWQHLFWTFGHPEVYIMALPAFGMISEIIPVFSRKPIFGYEFVAGSTVAIAILSLGVWAHHMFAVGLGREADLFFAAGSMLIAVPTGVKIFNWVATMWGGAIRFTTSMQFATAFLLEFVIGGLSGITFAAAPIDWQVTDTYYLVAHFHYVLFGGTAFALQAATYYWFPKMTGRRLSEKLGALHFWLMVIGFNTTFFVQHFLGIMGMPRRVYTYPDLPGWAALNLTSSIGAVIMAIAVVVFLWNMISSSRTGDVAGENPWEAWTLEWATSSPPPAHNFELVPPVQSRRPLYDLMHPQTSAALVHPEPSGTVHPERSRGTDKHVALMWSVIASEAVFFLVLILVYVIFNAFHPSGAGPTAKSALDLGTTSIFTACLLLSSGTLWLAERAVDRDQRSRSTQWLLATVALGLAFLGGQAHEYWGLWNRGIHVESSLFSSTFFTLTAFHGLHVTLGLLGFGVALVLGALGEPRRKTLLKALGMYWHFVDAVWVVVFSVVYLGAR